jgi:hypothetical protein
MKDSTTAEPALQTQTLSLRITEALRRRLDEVRRLAVLRKGSNISTSEIAKQLLEASRDERLEVVDLLSRPTEALLEIRRKGEGGHSLSRAEWTVLAYFVQQGAEAFGNNPVSRESLIAILEAFAALHRLRNKPAGQDEYYLGNLPTECRPERSKPSDPVTPEMVRQTVAETIRRLKNPATRWRPDMAARNLYVFLEEEKVGGVVALNEVLSPYWPALWRVAARGHYSIQREPVRVQSMRRELVALPGIDSLDEYFSKEKTEDHKYRLSFARGEGHEFSVLLSFPGRMGPMYPLGPYPMLTEFRNMLAELPKRGPEKAWDGEQFFGYVSEWDQARQYWFRARANGITFGFTADQWRAVETLFRKAWEKPDVRLSWDALSQEYGEL